MRTKLNQFGRKTLCLVFLLFAIQFRNGSAAFGAPPVGARYEKAIGLPVLGKQIFSLEIVSDSKAHLLVKGMLILDETVAYTVTSRGCLNCRLSERAQKQLQKVRASLNEVGYNVETDTPYVKVRTPLPAPVKIQLKRQNSVPPIESPLMVDQIV